MFWGWRHKERSSKEEEQVGEVLRGDRRSTDLRVRMRGHVWRAGTGVLAGEEVSHQRSGGGTRAERSFEQPAVGSLDMWSRLKQRPTAGPSSRYPERAGYRISVGDHRPLALSLRLSPHSGHLGHV